MNSYIHKSKKWIASFVIPLNLCPFAKKPFVNNKIRYILFEKGDLEDLALLLEQELLFLAVTSPKEIETSFIILPHHLSDFYFYLDFLDVANQLIFALRLEEILQIASFHPDYQFAGTTFDDVTNYTNRSPYPMLHLLREKSITDALKNYDQPEVIPQRNKAMMRRLGFEKVKEMISNLSD